MKPVHRVMCQRALKSPNTDEAVDQEESVCGRAAVLCLKRTVMGQCVMWVRTGPPPVARGSSWTGRGGMCLRHMSDAEMEA